MCFAATLATHAVAQQVHSDPCAALCQADPIRCTYSHCKGDLSPHVCHGYYWNADSRTTGVMVHQTEGDEAGPAVTCQEAVSLVARVRDSVYNLTTGVIFTPLVTVTAANLSGSSTVDVNAERVNDVARSTPNVTAATTGIELIEVVDDDSENEEHEPLVSSAKAASSLAKYVRGGSIGAGAGAALGGAAAWAASNWEAISSIVSGPLGF